MRPQLKAIKSKGAADVPRLKITPYTKEPPTPGLRKAANLFTFIGGPLKATIAPIAEIEAIDKAQYCPNVSVRKIPKRPAIAPNTLRHKIIPQKKANAISSPLFDFVSVLLLTSPAIPSPTGKVQGQTPVVITPAPAAINRLKTEP